LPESALVPANEPRTPPELHVSALLRRLTEAGVDFVVIGGIAVVLLGSARYTKDLDITYATDSPNLDALGQVLIELRARLRGIEEDVPFVPDGRTLRRMMLLMLDTDAGWLDLLVEPTGGPTYDELRAHATEVELDGFKVRVADVEDMIAMKKAAGRLQDLADIEELEAIKRLRAQR
jgi:predicted nucleotidyltransferase